MKLPALLSTPRFWNSLILCIFLVLTFPGHFSPMNPGGDPSWIYALNILPHTGFLFGRDIAFTYGPLGFLLEPLNVGSNLVIATIFRLSIHVVFAACIFYFVRRASNVSPTLLFSAGYMIAMVAVIELPYSYHLVILESLLVLIAFRSRRLWWIATPAAGVLAVVLLFTKFGIGLVALSIYIGAALSWLVFAQRGVLKVVLTVLSSCLVPFAVLSALFLRSIPNVMAWISSSMDMSDGVQSAQSLGGSRMFLLLALASAVVYVLLAFYFFRRKSDLRGIVLVFIPAVFLTFKHGFVRADGHERNFFPFVLALISVLILSASSRRERFALLTGYCLVLGFSMPVGIYYSDRDKLPSPFETLLGKKGLSNLINTLEFQRTQRTLDRESAANFRSSRLPGEWVEDIREHSWTVDENPSELTDIFVNNLNWDPQPTLQTFMTITPALDQRSAQHFSTNKGPDALIVEFVRPDYGLLEAPAMTRSILENYKLDREDVHDNLFLLKKRTEPLAEESTTLKEQEVNKGEWVNVPESDCAVLAHVDLSLSLFGRITKTLYRIPAVNVDLVYRSGQQQSYRVTPGVAEDGLLLNYLPTTPSEFSDFLHNQPFDKVVRVRLDGPGLKYYKTKVYLRWERADELKLSLESTAAKVETVKRFGSRSLWDGAWHSCFRGHGRCEPNTPDALRRGALSLVSGFGSDFRD